MQYLRNSTQFGHIYLGVVKQLREFGFRGYDNIGFQIEHACNNPLTPIEEPEVVEAIDWYDKEAVMFEYEADSEREVIESGKREGIDGHEGDEGVQSHDG
ncbi:hypothetical protein Ddye_027701 [Dipteronia dyeriana]|uniref:Uncharacterized protein n=1 Tax=Dipteronia dyeriana TaxID=168575 RepID=A0AAD9TQA1_9ROSI|nr:hypothetical protein Ddye_027701 [Dipteronia dyeriana]